jgi:uncharacterized protein
VVGLGLCPFAAAPLRKGRVRFALVEGKDAVSLYRGCLAEVLRLVETAPEQIETTLVIVPDGLGEFADYLGMLRNVEDALSEAGLEGVLQIASFHPDYRFEGAAPDDPANYTNRAPYPMFHLIREAGLAAALESYAAPERIPERNAALLRELGLDAVRRLLVG